MVSFVSMLVGGVGLKKGSNGVDKGHIILGNIMEGTVTKNQVASSHGSSIGSFVFVVDGGRITYAVSFFLSRQGHIAHSFIF